MALLEHLLTAPLPTPPDDAQGWAAAHAALPFEGPDAAAAGGFAADRPGWAFASGYRAALDALMPTARLLSALCVTESGGNHPRDIETRVVDGRLMGEKRFVFLGPLAQRLFVLARSGASFGGRPLLRLYSVDPQAEGVTITAGAPAPFVPEVPHGQLRLDTPAPQPLSGDGWEDYVKRFRTVEDVHVSLALLGWAVREARAGDLGAATIEGLLPPLLTLRALAVEDAGHPATHRALAAALDLAWQRLHALPLPDAAAALWQRDRAILEIGSQARDRRLERARQAGAGTGRSNRPGTS